MAKTTKKDFKTFCTEVDRWINLYGLRGWEITVTHEELDEGWAAKCVFWMQDRAAEVTLAKTWDSDKFEINDSEIRKAAFHEMTELLMSRLQIIAESRYILQREIEEEVHNVIKVLENVLFPKYS